MALLSDRSPVSRSLRHGHRSPDETRQHNVTHAEEDV